MRSELLLLLALIFIANPSFGQRIDEGDYNDWSFGAHGVYGNLRLTSTRDRSYFKVEKGDAQTAIVKHLNPSGIVLNTTTVGFASGALSKIEFTNQWGETYEHINLTPLGPDTFSVTDLLWGRNAYLPCKYQIWVFGHELLTEKRYYSYKGELAEGQNGYAIVRYKKYDDPVRFGESKETAYFDAQGDPVLLKSTDNHMLKTEYDDQDNRIMETTFGIRGEPRAVNKSTVSGVRDTFDTDNNEIKAVFLDTGGHITSNITGVTMLEYEYDHGYKLKETRCDSLGKPVKALSFGDGVAVIQYEYDNAGNLVRESYFDETGKPMNNHAGVQEIASSYSAANMLIQVAYFDEFGRPCVNRDKIHITKYVKDDLNRAIEESNLGLDGKPMKTFTEEVYSIRRKYDEYGRVIAYSYWLDSTHPMPHWEGYYEQHTKYNEEGQPVEYSYFDAGGEPFMAKDGSSSMRLLYNSDGRLQERQFLYRDNLIDRKRGVTMHYSIIQYGYDSTGKANELTFLGPDRKPVNATVWIEDSVQASRIEMTYKGSRIIEERYYKIGDTAPSQVIDCLQNDYINVNGISRGRKNEK